MEIDEQEERADATAAVIAHDWQEIARVMTIVEGEGYVDSLPEELELKFRGTEGGEMPLSWFRFGGGTMIYSREPVSGMVFEMRGEGAAAQVRAFTPEGEQCVDFKEPLRPEWN